MMNITKKQSSFADKVRKTLEDVRSARARNSSKAFKNTPNTEKVTVTHNGVYNDTYLPSIPAALERLSRVHASVLVTLMLEQPPLGADGKKSITVQGVKVNLNTPTIRDLLKIMFYRKQTVMKCAGCGCHAKYAYIERTILNVTDASYAVGFYCVHPNGAEYKMTVDHIDAKSTGGSKTATRNKQIMCSFCNSIKSSIPNDVFMETRKVIEKHMLSKTPV